VIRVALYLKYGSIEGSVTTPGLKGWIELDSLNWGVTNLPGTSGPGQLSVSDISIGKAVDEASVQLIKQLVAGRPTNGVIMKFYKSTTKGTESEYLQFTLANTLITSYTLDWDGAVSGNSALPNENLSLSFVKVDIQYVGQAGLVITVPTPG
jgi:type VI secretion system secreted protein Hcp